MKSKDNFIYGPSSKTEVVHYVINLAQVVQIRLRRRWSFEVITRCCISVMIFFLLYSFKDALLGHVKTNPWFEYSNNKFSYNICTVAVEKRHHIFISELQSSKGRLPPAHIIRPLSENFRQRQQCFLPKHGFSSWKKGIVTELVPGRTPKMCAKLFAEKKLDTEEEKWIYESNHLWRTQKNNSHLVLMTRNCTWVQNLFTDNFFVSSKEKYFPIAYAINFDKHPHQIIRFLKVIYRPHNLYCLHFDLKSSHTLKHVIFNLASCLDNVMIPRKIENVYRGWYTLVEAHASCFSDLMLARDRYPWKYVFTLCGTELPLRTNAEIVSLLEPLDGMSSIKLIGPNGLDDHKYRFKWSLNMLTGWITMRDVHMSSIPYNMKVYKSWAYVALSHAFVEYFLCSEVSLTLREYMKDAFVPEENIYPMLFMKPGVPVGYKPEYNNKIFVVNSCIWLDQSLHLNLNLTHYNVWWDMKRYCLGKNVNNICVVAAKDLAKLAYKPGVSGHLITSGFNGAEGKYKGPDRGPIFHNKYFLDEDVVVMDCMEQELVRRNKLEYEMKCGAS